MFKLGINEQVARSLSGAADNNNAELLRRRVGHRTRGHGHGPITRLMSPSDLGQLLKPFVFLDIFDMGEGFLRAAASGGGMPIHPHSGVATVTVLFEGRLQYDDPRMGSGTLGYGGVEWMRAGGGVWHGQEMSAPPEVSRVQGFQLWLALPPDVENGAPESRYIEAADMVRVGPAHVIVGAYGGVSSPVPSPEGVNYLLVTLRAGERWIYSPPVGHKVAWLALAAGMLDAGESITSGEMVLFEEGEHAIVLQAGPDEDVVFVLGSAVPHPHPLHLGNYSVHTSDAALLEGERRIAELGLQMKAAGNRRTSAGTVPVFR
ncbi:pirin family protein [Variovorax sp. J31P207]|uniref:pirin family protein n=1 Tax=Variovorax sp. J31P207 TaxID=3053510 RepID=UPI0025781BC5|nr:pirin family protein [Variovorax sp. J31P207]MDM0065280.1 pirin family protein [Variovorax sp. J31P207]